MVFPSFGWSSCSPFSLCRYDKPRIPLSGRVPCTCRLTREKERKREREKERKREREKEKKERKKERKKETQRERDREKLRQNEESNRKRKRERESVGERERETKGTRQEHKATSTQHSGHLDQPMETCQPNTTPTAHQPHLPNVPPSPVKQHVQPPHNYSLPFGDVLGLLLV